MKKHSLFFFVIFSMFFLQDAIAKNFDLSDTWVGEPDSGFRDLSLVKAKKYMVSSGSELSSKAGAEILAIGGNAIDAAIATSLVLNVVEPHSSGIGGGGFMLYYDKKTGKTIYFNGRETAPKNAKSDIFLNNEGKPREFSDAVRGGLSVGTPGLLKMMFEAHKKYGKLPFKDLFQPAIKIANDGFIVSERFHNLSKEISYLKDFKESAEIYLKPDGKPYEVGEKITNKKLAKTLTKIANNGIDDFYKGKIANDIASAVAQSPINPGYLSLSDLKNYKVKKGDLLCEDYRKSYKICTMPLPSGGVTLLEIMGILENFDLSKMKPNSLKTVHLITEATRLAYADRAEYIADSANVPVNELLNKEYLKKRAALINQETAMQEVLPGKFAVNDKNLIVDNKAVELPSTTHLSVIDEMGNAVSMTNSIEYFFGSALSVDGFLLNNQLTDFSFEPVKNGKKVANALAPNKQPRSSMAPTFVFDNKGKLLMIVGSPGGPRIIQFIAKAIINHLDFKLDIQNAISLASFVVLNNVIELEKNRDIVNLKSKLEKMGHKTKEIEIVSGINAITINNDNIEGGSDPRREGVAISE
ncbi:MAG: gamma-glutamyltransferase [Rickettsiales bacterium]|nr:gamma-glutamyltransferase [Rickettsiales bacterium]